jgi:hypothetical protein
MKLLLVSPSRKLGKKVLKAIKMPQLGLHILASLTPNDVDITVLDEEIREIDFSLDFDLVGISCMTATANRSYQLSDMYRQMGMKKTLKSIEETEEAIKIIQDNGIDTSLDWADNNEKWDSQKIRLDDKVLKGSNVFSSDQAHLPF